MYMTVPLMYFEDFFDVLFLDCDTLFIHYNVLFIDCSVIIDCSPATAAPSAQLANNDLSTPEYGNGWQPDEWKLDGHKPATSAGATSTGRYIKVYRI